MENPQNEAVKRFEQKGHCEDCAFYYDCPRMKGGGQCMNVKTVVELPIREDEPRPQIQEE